MNRWKEAWDREQELQKSIVEQHKARERDENTRSLNRWLAAGGFSERADGPSIVIDGAVLKGQGDHVVCLARCRDCGESHEHPVRSAAEVGQFIEEGIYSMNCPCYQAPARGRDFQAEALGCLEDRDDQAGIRALVLATLAVAEALRSKQLD